MPSLILSDRQLAEALETVQTIERGMRAAMQTEDLAERDQALTVGRHIVATRKSLEVWIGLRAIRAQLKARTA